MIQPMLCVFYKFTAKDICNLRSFNKSSRYAAQMMPTYAINPSADNIIESDYFFQFFDPTLVDQLDNPEEEYILFEVTTEGALDEEISNIGLTDLFEPPHEFGRLIPHIPFFETFESYNRCTPYVTTIMVDLIYEGDYEDTSIYCNLIGILDTNGQLIKI